MATMPMAPVRAPICPQLLPAAAAVGAPQAAALLAWRQPQGAARAPAALLWGRLHRALGQTDGITWTGAGLQVSSDTRLAAATSPSCWSLQCLIDKFLQPAMNAVHPNLCLARA